MMRAIRTAGAPSSVSVRTPTRPEKGVAQPSLSVILPAYNEEGAIAETLQAVIHALDDHVAQFEVIVVNDGSADTTGAIVSAIVAGDERVRLISHRVNRGYGAALVTGFEAVSCELAFFMDSDGQFDIRDIYDFLPLIERYDAVLGYRAHRQDSLMRTANAFGWKVLVWLALGVRVRDVDCAFKLFRAEFFRTHTLETRGAMINAEILFKIGRAGYTSTQRPVHHLKRRNGQATGAKLHVIVCALGDLAQCAWRWRWSHWIGDGSK